MTKRIESTVVEHNLPMIRIHRAGTAARLYAEENGLDVTHAMNILTLALNVIEENTSRYGSICPDCQTPVEEAAKECANGHKTYGGLGLSPRQLLVAFMPITSR